MQTALFELFESLLNQYIRLDPEYQKSLQQFSGCCILIETSQPSIKFYFFPGQQQFQILSHSDREPDTCIKASSKTFLQMLTAADEEKSKALFEKQILIEGDIALGQKFQQYFQRLDIDWEEHLSHFTGDVLAHQTFSLADKIKTAAGQAVDSFKQNWSEYLQYETRDLLEQREMDVFLSDIDKLREDVDRLQARINRLIG